MKKPIPGWTGFLLLIYTSVLHGQSLINVYDNQTGLPVNSVTVYTPDGKRSVLSDQNGNIPALTFLPSDTLIFQHPAYHSLHTTYREIIRQKYKVGLDENFIDLDEVVVSANRWEQNKSEVPNEIAVIKPREIVLQNPATSADMLFQSGQIFVQKSQLGGGSPMIRGFAANKILFVLDGVRMNNAIYRSGNLQNILQADVNSVESAEVILGPGTNIYGSDALGGVVDIHLKKPVINSDSGWRTSGTLSGRLASAAFEKSLHTGINIANNRIAFLTMISFTGFDDLKMGKQGAESFKRMHYVETVNGHDTVVQNENPYVQKFSGYNQWNLTQKFKYLLSPRKVLNMGVYYSTTSEVPRYDRLTQTKNGHLKYARWYYKPQVWLMTKGNIKIHNANKLYDHADITAAWQQVKEGRNDRNFQSTILRKRLERVNIFSLNADFDKKAGKHDFLFYGAEAVYNHVRSSGVKKNILTGVEEASASRYPDGGTDYWQSGIYISYKHRFRKIPMEFLSGFRYSYTALHALFRDTATYHLPYTRIDLANGALTGNMGFVFHPESWNFRLNFSSGFRAPNLDDVAKVFDSEPGNVVVPNKNLKPEYVYNAELGITKNFDGTAVLEMSAFYSLLKDAMVRGDFRLNGQDSIVYDGEISKVEAVVNTGSAIIYGWNATLSIQFSKHFGLVTRAGYIRGYDNNGNALRHVSPFSGYGALNYENKKLRLQINVLCNGEISYDRLAPSERNKTWMYAKDINGNPYAPRWTIFNFKGSYAFSAGFLMSFGVENIFDRYYRPYSSGISGPGRNFLLSLKYTF